MTAGGRIAFFTMILAVGIISFIYAKEIQIYLESLADLIKIHPVIGSFCFSFGLGISSMFFFPTTFPSILAGSIFPFWLAVPVVILGEQIGIILSFIIGKSLLREWIHSLVDRDARTRAIDRAVGEEGLKLVFLLRLTPVFPFGLCNYILAATRINLSTVCLASLGGNLPGCLIYVSCGALLGTNMETPLKVKLILGLIALGFAVGSSIFMTLFAQKALRGVVDLETLPEEIVIDNEVVSEDGDALLRRTSSQFTNPEDLSDIEAQLEPVRQVSEWTPKEKRILQTTTLGLTAYFIIGFGIIAFI
jgi:uncharacterized membrane protein YdjX (TVP38/TMEM64 family)